MDLPPDSAGAELVAVLEAVDPLNAPPERQARVLAQVLARRHARRSWVLACLSPAALAIALLAFGIATAAATLAPHLRWRWVSGDDAPAPVRRVDPPRPPAAPVVPQPAPPLPAPALPARARAAAADSPVRLMAAVRALRSDHQPARAERLALDYLASYPRGALAEEALAVAIEAAARSGDDRRATRLAGQYLRRYPAGRFTHLAQQARDQGP
jgi:hypothetical protein